jgi:hypothetical protein
VIGLDSDNGQHINDGSSCIVPPVLALAAATSIALETSTLTVVNGGSALQRLERRERPFPAPGVVDDGPGIAVDRVYDAIIRFPAEP